MRRSPWVKAPPNIHTPSDECSRSVPNSVPTTKPYRVVSSHMGTLEHPLM